MAQRQPVRGARPTDDWAAFDSELDAWAAAGRRATFWWRDDDAVAPSAALDRLAAVAGDATAPLALAVVPAHADPGLAWVAGNGIDIIQHGYAHVNHAPRGRGEGAWELGAHRPAAAVLDELDRGRRRLAALFGERFVAALAPPWNRIDGGIIERLPEAGLRGVSTFGPRTRSRPAAGVIQVNAHCDVIKWKGGPRFAGTARILDDVTDHLRARREGRADPEEPTGLLTHHLDMDEACWAFVAALSRRIGAHPAAGWRAARDLFAAEAGP